MERVTINTGLLRIAGLILLLSLLCHTRIWSQNTLRINHIEANEEIKSLIVGLNIPEESGSKALEARNLIIEEEVKGGTRNLNIDLVQRMKTENEKTEDWTVNFLIDLSGSMRNRLQQAKDAVLHTLHAYDLPDSTTYISTFHDTIFPRRIINRSNAEEVLKGVWIAPKGQGRDTDLYRATLENIKWLEEDSTEKKILIILTDGRNDIERNPYYKPPTNLKPITEDEIFAEIAKLDSSFLLYPIGLSKEADAVFLQKIANSTLSPNDKYKFAEKVEQVETIFKGVVSGLMSNYTILVKPQNPIFRGEERILRVSLPNRPDLVASKRYSIGSPTNIVDLRPKDPTDWPSIAMLGLLLTGGLLAVLSITIPYVRVREFRRKYVRPYAEVKIPRVTKRDPVTNLAFEDDEMVVVKCKTMCSLESWQYNDNQCPNYPACKNVSHQPCREGQGQTGNARFFSQKGVYKKLNWLWFGAIGGWVAWGILAIFKNLNLSFIHKGFAAAIDTLGITTDIDIEAFTYDILTGFSLGLGLALTLSLVEEFGQSRKRSYLRVFARALLTGAISLFAFFGGYLIFKELIKVPYLGGLASWSLFGLTLGFVLSFRASIDTFRAILGGLIASIIAYNIYVGINSFSSQDFEMSKMLSFLCLGGVLGFIIVTVVSRLEDFMLEYISPSRYSRVNPISKWLKTGMDIFIGTDSSCYVFIKWTDPAVESRHAKLSYDHDSVYIEPLAETLVNNVEIPLNKATKLQDGDIIQLGKESVSRMRYIEKRNHKATNSSRTSRSSNESSSRGVSVSGRPTGHIKIKRRIKRN